MEIRRTGPLDISALITLLASMHKEAEITLTPIDSDKLITVINTVIHRGVSFVAVTDDNSIAGSIGGETGFDWWSTSPFLSDYWFYVDPEQRNSSAAVRLAKQFVETGKEANVPVRIGHIFSGDLERKDKFYERLGFVRVGSTFVEK
tara:strand:+ start:79 stop:519 length:441 start_codon:yes stop_codon:yes gene_type:complete